MTMNSLGDRQEGGTHYKNFKIEPAEFIIKNRLDWATGNVIKYGVRHTATGKIDPKKGITDLLKAKHYIDMLLEAHYGADPSGKIVNVAPPGLPEKEPQLVQTLAGIMSVDEARRQNIPIEGDGTEGATA